MLVAIGVVLAILGSFAYLLALSLGTFFIACGLIARSVNDRGLASVVILVLGAVYLYVLATVASPLAYVALALLALAFALLVARILGRR